MEAIGVKNVTHHFTNDFNGWAMDLRPSKSTLTSTQETFDDTLNPDGLYTL